VRLPWRAHRREGVLGDWSTDVGSMPRRVSRGGRCIRDAPASTAEPDGPEPNAASLTPLMLIVKAYWLIASVRHRDREAFGLGACSALIAPLFVTKV